MFFLAATLVEWIGGDFVYRKVLPDGVLSIAIRADFWQPLIFVYDATASSNHVPSQNPVSYK